jgi:two-component system cell cycle response regulator DivK
MSHELILVVDDHAASRKLTRVILQGQGYDVRTAADAEEAMRLLQTFRPRMILTDINLPGQDGLGLTRQLKAEGATKDIVILALTACATRVDQTRALAAGCDGYIAKPIDVEALKQLVAGHLSTTDGTP